MPIRSESVIRRPRTARTAALETIRALILNGDLAEGEQIRDVDIAERLGVSRTPVREALIQLGNEGLVQFERGKQTVVTASRLERIPSLFQAAGALDSLAAELAAPAMAAADLEQMRSILAEMASEDDPDVLRDRDEEFHRVYQTVAGNSVVIATLASINRDIRLIEKRAFSDPEIRHEAHDEHQRIVDAFATGVPAAAVAAVAANWRNSLLRIQERLMNRMQKK